MVTIGGKADSSLIAAATAAAKVDQPVSTAKITEARVQQYGSFMEAMGKVYDNEKAKIEAERKPMEDAMTNILAKQADGTLEDIEIEGIQSYIDGKREELKKLPKGKKGEAQRQKLLADLNKFYNSYEVGNVENLKRAKFIDAGEYDAYNMGGVIKSTGKTISPDQALNLFKKLGKQDYYFEVDDNERSYGIELDDGSYFTVKQSDLKGIFKTKNKDAIAAFDALEAYALTLGQAEGSIFDLTEFRTNIKEQVFKSESGFSTIIKTPQKGNTKSYYEALHKEQGFMTAEMFSTLGELDPKLLEEYDVNKSGDLDAGDFTNEENYKKLISTLTDPTDPNFNRELAYNFAADWHTGSAMQANFDMGRKILKGKSGGGGGGGGFKKETKDERTQRLLNTYVGDELFPVSFPDANNIIAAWEAGKLEDLDLPVVAGKNWTIQSKQQGGKTTFDLVDVNTSETLFTIDPSQGNKGLTQLLNKFGTSGQTVKDFRLKMSEVDFTDIKYGAPTTKKYLLATMPLDEIGNLLDIEGKRKTKDVAVDLQNLFQKEMPLGDSEIKVTAIGARGRNIAITLDGIQVGKYNVNQSRPIDIYSDIMKKLGYEIDYDEQGGDDAWIKKQ
mgnify:CR=1 FL=1